MVVSAPNAAGVERTRSNDRNERERLMLQQHLLLTPYHIGQVLPGERSAAYLPVSTNWMQSPWFLKARGNWKVSHPPCSQSEMLSVSEPSRGNVEGLGIGLVLSSLLSIT